MIDKIFKQLKIVFISCVTLSIISFIIDVLYTTKYVLPVENIILERWCIIITLFGIFASIKLLHPKLKDSDKEDANTAVKIYARKYYFRLFVLMAVYVLNIVCLHFTGVKNFLFLAFITIFALFLCAPNKQQIEAEKPNLDE